MEIILSGNSLTGCLGDFFGSSDCPGFPSLKILQLENTKLSKDDLTDIFEALRDGKLPNLRNLKVSPLSLTDYLDGLLIAAHHPIFQERESITLENCNLSENAIKSICRSVRDGKLSNLIEVDLSDNKLTNCMHDLLGLFDNPKFPWLRRLCLDNCELSEVDVMSICTSERNGRLSGIEEVDLSYNKLTNCMSDLFGSLIVLDSPIFDAYCLNNCGLSKVDVVSIFNAGIKLAKLEELDLSNNSLTDSIGSLLRGMDHPGFLKLKIFRLKSCQLSITDLEILRILSTPVNYRHCVSWTYPITYSLTAYVIYWELKAKRTFLSLCQLMFDNTHLNKDDVHCISTALTFFKLPQLKLLSLKENSLCSAEKEVEMLIVPSSNLAPMWTARA